MGDDVGWMMLGVDGEDGEGFGCWMLDVELGYGLDVFFENRRSYG